MLFPIQVIGIIVVLATSSSDVLQGSHPDLDSAFSSDESFQTSDLQALRAPRPWRLRVTPELSSLIQSIGEIEAAKFSARFAAAFQLLERLSPLAPVDTASYDYVLTLCYSGDRAVSDAALRKRGYDQSLFPEQVSVRLSFGLQDEDAFTIRYLSSSTPGKHMVETFLMVDRIAKRAELVAEQSKAEPDFYLKAHTAMLLSHQREEILAVLRNREFDAFPSDSTGLKLKRMEIDDRTEAYLNDVISWLSQPVPKTDQTSRGAEIRKEFLRAFNVVLKEFQAKRGTQLTSHAEQ